MLNEIPLLIFSKAVSGNPMFKKLIISNSEEPASLISPGLLQPEQQHRKASCVAET
jgi:hypothetical protein